jgi:saccharopine dehydrogenase-like NADP-dependent oxidoreductase
MESQTPIKALTAPGRQRVLIIGGYGVFGGQIARMLAHHDLHIGIGGRSMDKAQAFCERNHKIATMEAVEMDIDGMDLGAQLKDFQPTIVIHAAGPYGRGYNVAMAAIAAGSHYLDLADDRTHVMDSVQLSEAARTAGVAVVMGASTLPGISQAVISQLAMDFAYLKSVDIGVTLGHRSPRGVSTVGSAAMQAGQPLSGWENGKAQRVWGWSKLPRRYFPGLGWRSLGRANCADLTLTPQCHPTLEHFRFGVGTELPIQQVGLRVLSWLPRLRVLRTLEGWTPLLTRLSGFPRLAGSGGSGLDVWLRGIDRQGKHMEVRWGVVSHGSEGLAIPCAAAVCLVEKLLASGLAAGAGPCVGLFSLDAMIDKLQQFGLSIFMERHGRSIVVSKKLKVSSRKRREMDAIAYPGQKAREGGGHA